MWFYAAPIVMVMVAGFPFPPVMDPSGYWTCSFQCTLQACSRKTFNLFIAAGLSSNSFPDCYPSCSTPNHELCYYRAGISALVAIANSSWIALACIWLPIQVTLFWTKGLQSWVTESWRQRWRFLPWNIKWWKWKFASQVPCPKGVEWRWQWLRFLKKLAGTERQKNIFRVSVEQLA